MNKSFINKKFIGIFLPGQNWVLTNSRTSLVEESIHVRFNDFKPDKSLSEQDNFLDFNLQELQENLPASTSQTIRQSIKSFGRTKGREKRTYGKEFHFD